MALRSSFGDILEPGLHQIFDDKFQEIPELFSKIFHVKDSSKDQEKDSAVTGFGLAQLTAEGGAIQYEDPIQMYDKSYVHLKYTKGFKVSEELYEDDLYNVISKKPAALARAFRRTAEYLASQDFANAFTSTALGGDGQELCSTVHPRADAGTSQSNASATGITLTETNLETGLLAMRGQLDDKGMRIMAKADTVLVPPALEKDAWEIVNSTGRSGTANNDANYYSGRLKVISWDYLTSSTAWFLIDSSLHELTWFWRKRPEFKQDNAFDTGMALYKSQMRLSHGWSDWRGVYGSQGDGNAYAN